MTRHRYQELNISGIPVQVIRKDHMKNLRLTIKAPEGRVVVSCPYYVSDAQIIDFVQSRRTFICEAQEKISRQAQELAEAQADQMFYTGKLIELLGEPYLLELQECEDDQRGYVRIRSKRNALKELGDYWRGVEAKQAALGIPDLDRKYAPWSRLDWSDLDPKNQPWAYLLTLPVYTDTDWETLNDCMQQVYRMILEPRLKFYTAKAEELTGLKAEEYRLKKMKTRWGTCNVEAKRIWLSTKLAAYPPQCLEYILVHELVHLVEKDHGERFQTLVSQYYPNWREAELLLNGPRSKFL